MLCMLVIFHTPHTVFQFYQIQSFIDQTEKRPGILLIFGHFVKKSSCSRLLSLTYIAKSFRKITKKSKIIFRFQLISLPAFSKTQEYPNIPDRFRLQPCRLCPLLLLALQNSKVQFV